MSKKIRIGVLGCANIAKKFVIPAINELNDNFILVGIASRDYNKAQNFAELFNTNAFHGYDSLLENKNIDAVYIPLPNSMHYEWIKKSLKKGLHVIVEKSLACEYSQVLELNNLAKEKGLVLFENFQFRFHPQLMYIKECIDKKRIGELRNMRSSFGFPPFKDQDNIRYNKYLGGGALFDAGAYPVKISQLLLGFDLCVINSSIYIDPVKEVDIWGNASLGKKNENVVSQISFGFDNYYQCSVELWGSLGKITAKRIFTSPPGLEAEIIIEDNAGVDIIKIPPSNHFINMLGHFELLINDILKMEKEYIQNNNQSRLLNEIKEHCFEK